MSTGGWLFLYSIQWVLTIFTLILVIGMMRKIEPMTRDAKRIASPTGFMDGEKIPEIIGARVSGTKTSIVDLIARNADALVLLVSPTCKTCDNLLYRLLEMATRPSFSFARRVILIVGGQNGGRHLPVRRLAESSNQSVDVLFDEPDFISRTLGVQAVPVGFLLDSAGIIRDQKLDPVRDGW